MTATAVVDAKQYRQDVFAEMRGVDAERGQAAIWEQTGNHTRYYVGFMAVTMLVPTLLSLPSFVLHLAPLPPAWEGAASGLTSLCTTLFVVCAAVGLAFWRTRRAKSRPTRQVELGPGSKLACPHCGAPNQLLPGQHVQTCGHCRGALMPGRTAMIAGLDAARAARRRATLDRYRAERAGMHATKRSVSAYAWLVPLVFGVALLPTLLGVCLVPASGAEEVTGLGVLIFAVGMFIVLALFGGVGGFAFVQWRKRVVAWKTAVTDIARQFHGRSSSDVGSLVTWLDQAWAGPYDLRFLGGGPRFELALLDAFGFPTAVALNPTQSSMNMYETTPTYARIMLAAWIPSRTDGGPPPTLGPAARETMAWLTAAGFLVSCEEAGILAMAQERVVRRLREEPGCAHLLAPVVGNLARLAHEIGAQPVQITPGPGP